MRIPITKYGLPQVVVFPLCGAAAMIGSFFVPIPLVLKVPLELVLLIMFIWALAFFRDPRRRAPADTSLLVAPADGRITDIETVQAESFIGGQALRIGIFLSIFDVHINRAPCNVQIGKITYKKGLYKDARHPDAGKVNESNDLALIRTDEPRDKLLVRQISGAIARRIVCEARVGEELRMGQKFGMIKFGSRTELYVPAGGAVKCLVKIGDKVKAGVTVLAKYESGTVEHKEEAGAV